MKAVLLALLATLSLSFASTAQAHGHCTKYEENKPYIEVLRTLAGRMQMKILELCDSERILDIQIVDTTAKDIDENYTPHTWVTLHYGEYSCQYFFRNSDHALTKSNCYNTY